MDQTEFQVPTDPVFLQNLVLQRTNPFINLGGAAALKQWFVDGQKAQLVEFLCQADLIEEYLRRVLAEVAAEVSDLVQSLPRRDLDTIVSIGPGNGLFELMLLRSVSFKQVLLIDIEFSEGNTHGFNPTGSGYASLAATKAFLADNGVDPARVVTLNPQHDPLPTLKFDLLISMLSMGFHYPCDDYAAFMLENINPAGRVVIDKRRGVQDAGFDRLLGALRPVKTWSAAKSDRVVLQALP